MFHSHFYFLCATLSASLVDIRRELLLTYAARPEHATRGYTQGMSDLLAPLIAVLHPHLPVATAPPSLDNAGAPDNAAAPDLTAATDNAGAHKEGAGDSAQSALRAIVRDWRVTVADLYFCFEYLMDHSVCVASPHDDDIDSHLVCK